MFTHAQNAISTPVPFDSNEIGIQTDTRGLS